MKQNTDGRRHKIAKLRERFAHLRDYMEQHSNEILELMLRRHAYYTQLITDAGIKTAEEFYERYSEQFLMYGIKLKLSDNKKWCSINLELEDNDYENYRVVDGKNDALAKVSPKVAFNDLFHNDEVNIFTG